MPRPSKRTDRLPVATRPRKISPTKIEAVAGCLKWTGAARTLADMDRAIEIGAREQVRATIPDPYLEARAKRGNDGYCVQQDWVDTSPYGDSSRFRAK